MPTHTQKTFGLEKYICRDGDSLSFTVLQVGEARALYNMGNVFHAKGKQQLWGCTQEPGDLPSDVRDTLQRATGFYEYVFFILLCCTADECIQQHFRLE